MQAAKALRGQWRARARPSFGTRRAPAGGRILVLASAKASAALEKARQKYNAGDRMGALKLYEDVCDDKEATTVQKQRAWFGATAVHACFGDVELAQITLREAVKTGLDFEQALDDSDMVQIQTSTQILLQLRKFNQRAQAALINRPAPPRMAASRPWAEVAAAPSGQDLSSILGSATSDQAAIDTSVPAILRRVALVLLVGVLLGTGLFFAGLEFLFPKYS